MGRGWSECGVLDVVGWGGFQQFSTKLRGLQAFQSIALETFEDGSMQVVFFYFAALAHKLVIISSDSLKLGPRD